MGKTNTTKGKTVAKIETGHAKNVANYEQLTAFVSGYGAAYNPSKTSIKLATMQATLANARKVVEAVNAALPANKNAIAAREVAFAPLSKLIPGFRVR